MRDDGTPDGNEEELYEQLHEALFGQFEELVNEAEDLAQDAGGHVGEGDDEAQLWEEIREKYVNVRHELQDRETSINDAERFAQLEAALDVLKQRAEAAYGTEL